jgi:hypothetical protein
VICIAFLLAFIVVFIITQAVDLCNRIFEIGENFMEKSFAKRRTKGNSSQKLPLAFTVLLKE